MNEKVCSKCKLPFPLTSEYWPKRATSKDGFRGQCLNCWREKGRNKMKQWRKDNPEKAKVAHNRAYWKNPEKWRQKAREWYQKNKEHVAEYNKHYREENPEIVKEATKRFYDENPEYRSSYYQDHKEERNEYDRQWTKGNLEKKRAAWHRRQARIKGNGGSYTGDQIKELLEAQERFCFHCGADISEYYEIDHWIPLTRNGSNNIENIRLLCQFCNRSKGNKLPHEWHPNIYPSP